MKEYNSELKAFIKGHLKDDPFSLSLKKRPDDVNMDLAINQIRARQKAKTKLPSWYENLELFFPPTISVEQSSSEHTAAFKASLLTGKKMADLTGGMGIDSAAFAGQFDEVHYVEQQAELMAIADHNFRMLGHHNVTTVNDNAIHFLGSISTNYDLIYLDPGRRPGINKKTYRLEESEPNVVEMVDLLLENADKILLKLSPLLDLKYAIETLKYVSKVWVVAVNNECKELLVLLENSEGIGVPEVEAIDIMKGHNGFVFTFEGESSLSIKESEPLKYLYEPNAAILKAGAFKSIAKHFDLLKLHKHTHLYTSAQLVNGFPGRKFLIKSIVQPNKKAIGKILMQKKANIAVRNFPMKPEVLKRKWGLTDGGIDYLFAVTTCNEEKRVLLCEKL